MSQISETLTVLFAAFLIVAAGYEVNRRQKKLRAVYDVLDTETRHIAAELEGMIQSGALKPFVEETWG